MGISPVRGHICAIARELSSVYLIEIHVVQQVADQSRCCQEMTASSNLLLRRTLYSVVIFSLVTVTVTHGHILGAFPTSLHLLQTSTTIFRSRGGSIRKILSSISAGSRLMILSVSLGVEVQAPISVNCGSRVRENTDFADEKSREQILEIYC